MLFAKEGVIVRDFGVFAQDGAVVRDFGVICKRRRYSARFRCYLQKKAL